MTALVGFAIGVLAVGLPIGFVLGEARALRRRRIADERRAEAEILWPPKIRRSEQQVWN